MRILMVLPNFGIGGAEAIVSSLSEELVNRGENVFILDKGYVIYEINKESISEINSLNKFYKEKLNLFRELGSILRFITGSRDFIKTFDVIHCHLTFGQIVGVLIAVILPFNHPKITLSLHGIGMKKRIRNFLMDFYSFIFFNHVVSVFPTPLFGALAKLYPKRFSVVVNAYAESRRENTLIDTHDRLRIENSSKDLVQLGTIIRLERERRPEKLLRVVQYLERQSKFKFILYILGEGTYREKIERDIVKLELTDSIRLCDNNVDKGIFLNSLDLYISLNVGKYSGIAAYQAIKAGIPVISFQTRRFYRSNRDEIPSFYREKKLAGKILFSVKNPESLGELAKNQYSFLEKSLSMRIMVDRYLAIYNSLAKGL